MNTKTPRQLNLHLGYVTCRLLEYHVIEWVVILWWRTVDICCLSRSYYLFPGPF